MEEEGEQPKHAHTQTTHGEIKTDKCPSIDWRDRERWIEQPGYEKNRQANRNEKEKAVDRQGRRVLGCKTLHAGIMLVVDYLIHSLCREKRNYTTGMCVIFSCLLRLGLAFHHCCPAHCQGYCPTVRESGA